MYCVCCKLKLYAEMYVICMFYTFFVCRNVCCIVCYIVICMFNVCRKCDFNILVYVICMFNVCHSTP